MPRQQPLDPNARTAFENLQNEFAKELVINNPNAGITTKRLTELSYKKNQYTKNLD